MSNIGASVAHLRLGRVGLLSQVAYYLCSVNRSFVLDLVFDFLKDRSWSSRHTAEVLHVEPVVLLREIFLNCLDEKVEVSHVLDSFGVSLRLVQVHLLLLAASSGRLLATGRHSTRRGAQVLFGFLLLRHDSFQSVGFSSHQVFKRLVELLVGLLHLAEVARWVEAVVYLFDQFHVVD